MRVLIALVSLLCLVVSSQARSQTADRTAGGSGAQRMPWRPALPPGEASRIPGFVEVGPGAERVANWPAPDDSPPTTTVNVLGSGFDLPATAGQVWKAYDLSPYTDPVTTTSRPQQAIVDWIVNETGSEMWFNEPMGVLNASRQTLHVYHTPAVHQIIQAIVDRFVHSRGQLQVYGLRLVTIGHPNWRSTAYPMLQPIEVNASAVEGWMISKENAAILINQLSKRNDFRQHNAGDLALHDGQQYGVTQTRPVSFLRSIRWVNDGMPRFEPMPTRIDEGYKLDFSALTSLDGRTVEAVVGCQVDQIERLQPVTLDLPTPTGQNQTIQLNIPQVVSWKLKERFRWPSDQVLLLSCGVVATPSPQRDGMLNLSALFNGSNGRADALLFIEYKGLAEKPGIPGSVPAVSAVPITGRR